MPTGSPARPNRIVTAALAAAPVMAAAVVGNLATFSGVRDWYPTLIKPGFTPPNWLFGPAWTLLYILMAIAFWRILMTPKSTPGKSKAIVWFLIQMTLNALWSLAFFGARSPLAGLVVIGLLIAAIIMTIVTFSRLDRPAAWLLAPYLAWVSFATALNAGVWILNG